MPCCRGPLLTRFPFAFTTKLWLNVMFSILFDRTRNRTVSNGREPVWILPLVYRNSSRRISSNRTTTLTSETIRCSFDVSSISPLHQKQFYRLSAVSTRVYLNRSVKGWFKTKSNDLILRNPKHPFRKQHRRTQQAHEKHMVTSIGSQIGNRHDSKSLMNVENQLAIFLIYCFFCTGVFYQINDVITGITSDTLE